MKAVTIKVFLPHGDAKLLKGDVLHQEKDSLLFTRDVEFSSPSAAAAIIHGGSGNGLIAWKDKSGRTLKQIEND